MHAMNLQVNHMPAPTGISGEGIRLSWNADGGIWQSAYQIVIKNHRNKMILDTGKIAPSCMYAHCYSTGDVWG